MPRLVLPLMLAALLLASATTTQAQSRNLPNPLGLRGINLGMTLADVRKLRHPDADQQKSDVKVSLTCAGEPAATAIGLVRPPDSALDGTDIALCRFYTEDKDGIRDMPMNVGGHDAQVVLWFTPEKLPSATAARLYQITVLANPIDFDSLAEAYQSKFGETTIATMPVSGNSQPIRVLLWNNAVHRLTLLERMAIDGFAGGRTMVMYTDLMVEEVVKGTGKKNPGADKL
jgi:hypothetical protein